MIAARYRIVDYLAAVPLVEDAGGVMCDRTGVPLTVSTGDRFVMMGNPARLPETLDLLASQMEGERHGVIA